MVKFHIAREGIITRGIKVERFKVIIRSLFSTEEEKTEETKKNFYIWDESIMQYFKKIFVDNWFRKLISLFVAIIIWFVVNDSLRIPTRQSSSNTIDVETIK